jgi:hypothetical protein
MDQYIKTDWLGISISFFSVMCLQSIDEVAKELENPFRNIPNELPVVTYQAEFNEALLTIYSGFHPDSFWKAPRAYRKHRDVILKSQSSPKDDMSIINESSFRGADSGSEKTDQWKEGQEDAGEHEKMNAQLRLIVKQQGRMMEQMMEEQKRLNMTLEKVLDRTVPQDS